jgi:hypothetical protein
MSRVGGRRLRPSASTASEKPHHAAFSSPLSSISRSRSLARSADEAAESSSFASLPCLSSSSRSDVGSSKFPSPFLHRWGQAQNWKPQLPSPKARPLHA